MDWVIIQVQANELYVACICTVTSICFYKIPYINEVSGQTPLSLNFFQQPLETSEIVVN